MKKCSLCHTSTRSERWREENGKEAQKKSVQFHSLFASSGFGFAYNAAPSTKLEECQCVFVVQSFFVLFSSFFSLFFCSFRFFPFYILFASILLHISFKSIDFFFLFLSYSTCIRFDKDYPIRKSKKKNCCRWNSICEYYLSTHLRHILIHPFFFCHNSYMNSFQLKFLRKHWNKGSCFFFLLFNGSAWRICAYSVYASSQYRIMIAKIFPTKYFSVIFLPIDYPNGWRR